MLNLRVSKNSYLDSRYYLSGVEREDRDFWTVVNEIPTHIRKKVLKSRTPPISFSECHIGEGDNKQIIYAVYYRQTARRKPFTYIWEDVQDPEIIKVANCNETAALAFYVVASEKVKVSLVGKKEYPRPKPPNALFRMQLEEKE